VKSEEHRSPDGRLTLLVRYEEDEDISIGFAGFPWHIHADGLAPNYPGVSLAEAAHRFVEDVIFSRAVIAIVKVHGDIRDIWITEGIEQELRYKQADEEIEFRYWDGTDALP